MNCPVCLNPSTAPSLVGTDFLFKVTQRTFHLSACASCDCLFIDPLPTTQEIATFYPADYWWNAGPGKLNALEAIYRRIALRDHLSFIASAAKGTGAPRGRLLDVGCGSGTILGLMKRQGFDVTGVDFSREAAEIAGAQNGVKVIVGSLHNADFANESFDVVTLFHVLEHVTNPRDVLIEARRILQPNGRLVLQVPNIGSWQFRVFGTKWYGLDIPRHVIDYSKQSIYRLLEETGFVPVRIRNFNLRDNAPALASSISPKLDPLSRTVRQRRENVFEPAGIAFLRHALYFGLVIASYPVAMLESAVGRGATIMLEARKA
jgi:2-polyprenyl-3-methyl-5-hydroxy-6-metoxy-1,4-benzoquinol methylase